MNRQIFYTSIFFAKHHDIAKGLSLEAQAVYFNAIIISPGQYFKASSCLHNQLEPLVHGLIKNKHGAYV